MTTHTFPLGIGRSATLVEVENTSLRHVRLTLPKGAEPIIVNPDFERWPYELIQVEISWRCGCPLDQIRVDFCGRRVSTASHRPHSTAGAKIIYMPYLERRFRDAVLAGAFDPVEVPA